MTLTDVNGVDFQVFTKCQATTIVRLWTKTDILANCSLDFGHEGEHLTYPQPLHIDGRYGQIIFKESRTWSRKQARHRGGIY